MSTTIKPEVSKKNPYHISKYRMLELRNFCLQYIDWKATLRALDGYPCKSKYLVVPSREDQTQESLVERAVITRQELEYRVNVVETAAKAADPELEYWILKGVTIPESFDILLLKHKIPCSRDTYYKRYRKFFCILDKLRG